jgi:hypothetical protein
VAQDIDNLTIFNLRKVPVKLTHPSKARDAMANAIYMPEIEANRHDCLISNDLPDSPSLLAFITSLIAFSPDIIRRHTNINSGKTNRNVFIADSM